MRRVLGKGLRELIAGADEENGVREIEITQISPNPNQPRKHFNQEMLQELAESIQTHGLLQPLIVRASGHDHYELIAGERRFRAAKIAGLNRVPVVIRDADHRESLELALIENIQREDISPVEAATAYKTLLREFDLTQEDVANRVGKSRTAVANALRLLKLPETILSALDEGKISEGHARALLQLDTSAEQQLLFFKIIEKELTVRETERLARGSSPAASKKRSGKSHADPPSAALSERLGAPVTIARAGRGGQIRIEFYDEDDLGRILDLLGTFLD